MDIIAISPAHHFIRESEMINRLFEIGLYRYHLNKEHSTEQALAEILEHIDQRFLRQITLHSHFHLVLAFGVGGIHYSHTSKTILGGDLQEKINLYQGFGIKASVDISDISDDIGGADYAIIESTNQNPKDSKIFILDPPIPLEMKFSNIALRNVLWESEDPGEKFKKIQSQLTMN